MPYQEKDTEKLYYSIGEVATLLGLSASQIRFWEKEFDTIKPHKNKKGNRLFTTNDIEALKKVNQLVKQQGYTLDGAKQAIVNNQAQVNQSKENAITYLKIIKGKVLDLLEKS